MESSETYDVQSEQRIRLASGEHAVLAAELGQEANDADTVLRASHLLWNASTIFLSSTGRRRFIEAQFEKTISCLQPFVQRSGKNSMDPVFRARLYQALLFCKRDRCNWDEGVSLCDTFLRIIPSASSKRVEEIRMYFLSRLGKDITAREGGEGHEGRRVRTLFRSTRESRAKVILIVHYQRMVSSVMNAKIFRALARQAKERSDIMRFYIDCIHSVRPEISQAPFVVEFAEWIASELGDTESAVDMILLAVDDIESQRMVTEM
jgi:hypothetical protein